VSSQAKIKASRANGRKGGPRTVAGKSNASRNALRHGLAAMSPKQPEIVAEIEPITSALCGASTDPLLFEQALIIAENAFVLRCVQVEYIAAIERHRDSTVTPLATGDLGFARAKATLARAKLTYEVLVKRNAQAPAAENAAGATDELNKGALNKRQRATTEHVGRVKPVLERDEFDAMRSAMPDLDRLERYRRRAWSRQRRAIRRFMEIQSALGVPRTQLDVRVEQRCATGESRSMADGEARRSSLKAGLHEQRSGIE
jgi:hypothetical protein